MPTTKAKTLRRERKVKGGSIIVEWDQVVAKVTASSNEGAVSHLWDNDATTYWQSSGPQGKVRCLQCVCEGEGRQCGCEGEGRQCGWECSV